MAPPRITVDSDHFEPFNKPGSMAPTVLCRYCRDPKKGSFVRSGKGRLLAHLDGCQKYQQHLKEQAMLDKPMKQASIQESFPALPVALRQPIDRALAESIIISGSPFSYYDKTANPQNYHLL